jgi:hypothetical protein
MENNDADPKEQRSIESFDEANIHQHRSIQSSIEKNRELYESTADNFAANLFTSSNIRNSPKVSSFIPGDLDLHGHNDIYSK